MECTSKSVPNNQNLAKNQARSLLLLAHAKGHAHVRPAMTIVSNCAVARANMGQADYAHEGVRGGNRANAAEGSVDTTITALQLVHIGGKGGENLLRSANTAGDRHCFVVCNLCSTSRLHRLDARLQFLDRELGSAQTFFNLFI